MRTSTAVAESQTNVVIAKGLSIVLCFVLVEAVLVNGNDPTNPEC